MDFLKDLENDLEAKADPTSESEKLIVRDLSKEARWKAKRCGKITSSTLPDLMKSGRGSIEWGETAKKVLYPVKYERRTGIMRESKDYIKNFIWGKENEPKAIDWLKRNGYPDIIHSDDLEDIIFNTPFDGFGDSPDFISEKLVGEIKCHVDVGLIESMREEKAIHDKQTWYWQVLGHFVGAPEAETLLFVSYDAYADDAHVIEMHRKDHLANIEKLEKRIKDANSVVNAALKGETTINQINEFLS